MKYIKLYEDFVTEKAYRMTGPYSAKGLIGAVMQPFKKEIEKITFEGDEAKTLKEVNAAWNKFQKTAEKIILDQVEKGAKSLDSVVYVTATLGNQWVADTINKLNREGSSELFITCGEIVINVGFMDDVDGNKLYKKIDKTGMMNSPVSSGKDAIYGNFDSLVGFNNLEIRGAEYISIDAK